MRATSGRILLASAVGVVAGLGAVAFHALSELVMHYAVGWGIGYEPGGPMGGAALFLSEEHAFWPWMLLVVPAAGGLVSGWLVYRYAPEAEGHGTDAAIDAYHNKRGVIRARVPIIKTVASAITLGTGGSGGREGPIAQIGAGFGSYLGTKLKLSDAHRRVLLAAGIGGGIGAIFQAPLAGAMFAIEVLYGDPDFESEALIPAFIATTIAYCVFNLVLATTGVVEGFGHLFFVAEGLRFENPLILLPLTVLVVVVVLVAWIYVKIFYGIHDGFHRLRLPNWVKPGIGGLGTGVFALGLYYAMSSLGPDAQNDSLSVLGYGYGFLQDTLISSDGAGLMIPVLLAVGVGKIITTSLTIGSGGSGGVFGPSMVIGGSFGAIVGLLFHSVFPQLRVDVFAILGMAGFFAAAAKTPVSTLIMVTELTASYELLLPSMWVCALAYLFSRGGSIYREQVPTHRESAAHRGDYITDVLQGLTIRDALGPTERRFITVPLQMPLDEVVKLITGTRQTCFPVVDSDRRYYGLFSLNDVRQFLYDSEMGGLAIAQDLATPNQPMLELEMDLGTAIERFASGYFGELPVVDPEEDGKIIGMLRRHDVISTYNRQLMRHRPTGGAGPASGERTPEPAPLRS